MKAFRDEVAVTTSAAPIPSLVGRRAVVVGSGLAGLTAARALADYFEQVIVLEQDVLPAHAAHRAGTPQSRHLHVLLPGGLHALNELFPQFTDDLDQSGAVQLRVGLDVRVERPGYDPFPQRDLGWLSRYMSRPLLEFALRKRVAQCGNVELRPHCRVRNFLATSESAAIAGVGCEYVDGSAETLPVDFVVDASGRGSLTLKLLQSVGQSAPAETAIGIDMAYATSVFDIPNDAPTDWKGVMVLGAAPHDVTGAQLLPLEGNRWMVTVGEGHSDGLPADAAGFLGCVRRLRTPTIHDAIKHAKPLGDVARFGFPASVRRHYERLPTFPRGLLCIGDALCRFNPVYGQGMAVAAQEACLLRRVLSTLASERDPLLRLASVFFDAAQAILETPWAMANLDFVFPQTRGQRPADLERTIKFGIALNRLAAEDPSVHKLMLEVQTLLKPRSVYRDPDLLRRVTAAMAQS
jgi:2-polyprenyl-6-methoxyphenol hydroxylase-like FAD-dependent oxidoreductase